MRIELPEGGGEYSPTVPARTVTRENESERDDMAFLPHEAEEPLIRAEEQVWMKHTR